MLENSKKDEEEDKPYTCPSNLSLIENVILPSGFLNTHPKSQLFGISTPPNIEHELNVAKSLMQQGSSRTGDSLFDHLADIIKRVVKERPQNIADYFEEFSYNVREQKFRIPERFPWRHYKPPNVKAARKYFAAMKMPSEPPIDYDVCLGMYSGGKDGKTRHPRYFRKRVVYIYKEPRKLVLSENVLRLSLYWALCGFKITPNEVQRLSCAMKKIQFQPTVEHARFWGKIYGLRKSYYIAEVMLARSEIDVRLEEMHQELKERRLSLRKSSTQVFIKNIESELFPGMSWEDQPNWPEELDKDKYCVKDLPRPKTSLQFDIPPEAVGTGLNRKAYFVVNSLDDDWIELPIVTPKQIQVSRQIKKFLTGDLETEIVSYPSFPGTEKHYLRAMIARITSGTYIAPNGYYRKLTKREQMRKERSNITMNESEFEVELEDDELNNDAMITEDANYIPNPETIMYSSQWVHVRPNILNQGRVVYLDEAKAQKEALRESFFDLGGTEMLAEEEVSEESEVIEEDDGPGPESGPALFTQCSEDVNTEVAQPWSHRYSSVHNKINQLTIMRSNVWPGAHSYTFDKYSDSIYLGWGIKSIDRNMTVPHVPPIQEDYDLIENKEETDPTAAMEERWHMWQKKKQMQLEGSEEEEEDVEDDGVC